ncbi:2-dehydropantoate 2-reductase [Cytophagaceae bacterium 50C-KIRBA]|uniref:2-dehydropantoate 2-reductase n=1 Tax=Aquirufa beregesia TaxID=2516556 RepID=A0ABX0EYP0_9BACT|nr:2-dehydropantoate 2-reductase [Aquirufa beregesia]NGZ44553.1 2-dehydropantoate 2-reductase [Aquirufa beregesia]
MNTNQKTRIAIAGIGGIGGYIGGKLAYHYQNSENIEILFISRGENQKVIDQQGLTLHSGDQTYVCVPSINSHDPAIIGQIDALLICTKSYSTTSILKEYARCLRPNAVIITTQNTVNGQATVADLLPKGITLLEGCIFIASNIQQAGIIEHKPGPTKLFFGTNKQASKQGEYFEKLLQDAGIDTKFTQNIQKILWKKFLFVSPIAIVSALTQQTFSQILENESHQKLFIQLTTELIQLAQAKHIPLDENTIKNNVELLGKFNPTVKSSFQLDLAKGNLSEIDSLLTYVIREATSHSLKLPHYEKAFEDLRLKYPHIKA